MQRGSEGSWSVLSLGSCTLKAAGRRRGEEVWGQGKKILIQTSGDGQKIRSRQVKQLFIKNVKALCLLCGCFLVSRGEKTAQASLHSKENHLFGSNLTLPSSCLLEKTPPQSMGSFGFPGRMVSPHSRVLAALGSSMFVEIRVWDSQFYCIVIGA